MPDQVSPGGFPQFQVTGLRTYPKACYSKLARSARFEVAPYQPRSGGLTPADVRRLSAAIASRLRIRNRATSKCASEGIRMLYKPLLALWASFRIGADGTVTPWRCLGLCDLRFVGDFRCLAFSGPQTHQFHRGVVSGSDARLREQAPAQDQGGENQDGDSFGEPRSERKSTPHASSL